MKLTIKVALELHKSASNILATIKYKEQLNDSFRANKARDEDKNIIPSDSHEKDIQTNMLDILKLKSSYRKIMEDIVLKLC